MTVGVERVKTFLVPDLGEGLEDVTVTSWDVAVGDPVVLNQPLCSVETAKAQVEIPSPYGGRIVELGGAEGDVLDVGAPLVRIDTDPDSAAGPEPDGATAPESEAATGPEPISDGQPVGRAPVLVGYGADDSFDTSVRTRTGSDRLKAKPAARKLAAELGVDLGTVAPGPAGVITREAVLAASGAAPADYDVLAVGAVQSAMAERMTLSRSQIPDAHARVEVDCTSLLRLCDRLSGDAAITPFVLTLRLLVLALSEHRVLNSTWVATPDGPQVHSHRAIHLGFGVAAPRGLLVPVVTDAQRRTTRDLAECVTRLIRDARAGSLSPAELRGSTFTVSNFGALGVDDGVPVINYPEAAILGMGAIKPRPAVIDGAVLARPQTALTCAFDHRIADGAQVAAFLCRLRDLIESPETALLDL